MKLILEPVSPGSAGLSAVSSIYSHHMLRSGTIIFVSALLIGNIGILLRYIQTPTSTQNSRGNIFAFPFAV